MQVLVERLATAASIEPPLAEKALGMILIFLEQEVPPQTLEKLRVLMPGAEALVPPAPAGGLAGLFGGMLGGGVMGLGGQLMGAGLGMDEIQALARELFAFTAEHGGPDLVGELTSAVPGLEMFA